MTTFLPPEIAQMVIDDLEESMGGPYQYGVKLLAHTIICMSDEYGKSLEEIGADLNRAVQELKEADDAE
jgi:hypothetical protein